MAVSCPHDLRLSPAPEPATLWLAAVSLRDPRSCRSPGVEVRLSENAERYRRLKATPEARRTAATVAWLQGYEAGWEDAANRWMTQPAVEPTDDDSAEWGAEDAA